MSGAANADTAGRIARSHGRIGRAAIGRGLTWQFLGATALLLLVGTAVIGGLVMATAEQQNRATLTTERHLAVSALNSTLGDLGHLAIGYALWDDAIDHLPVQVDAGWAQAHVGARLIRSFNLTASLALDRNGHRMFAAVRDGIDAERPWTRWQMSCPAHGAGTARTDRSDAPRHRHRHGRIAASSGRRRRLRTAAIRRAACRPTRRGAGW